ncbi:MAG: septal ring lytic transglycosylase RlpA family protein [Comamonadaceae bacterium]|nr:septal ring lytic transglycosylase RlpA family protein [Rubrivivax sp.]NLZ43177.1 septal ring lytic transglycosylase RlpA family protein [Comamonadaceae bacterium]
MQHRRRAAHVVAALAATLALAGCATRAPRPGADGPEARPPSGLERTPDAVPRIEPIRSSGPNKPYEAFGRSYVPVLADLPMAQSGLASWYGRKYHGRSTASGEPYDMYAMTAAHPTMPLPSYARVRNPANGSEVVVRVNDRGPFVDGRVIDLSYTAALRLGLLRGVAPVQLRRITNAEILAAAAAAPAAEAAAGPSAATAAVTDAVATAASLPDSPAPDGPLQAAGFWLQLGAFRARDAAAALQQRALLEADLPWAAVREEEGLFRVQAGPWATRAEAQAAAERLHSRIGVVAYLLERR